MTLTDHLHRVIACDSMEEVWALHCARMAGYGFDRLIYGFTRFGNNGGVGDLQDAVILSNHDQRFIDRFLGEEHYRHGPMMRWTAQNHGACSWSWIEEQQNAGLLSDQERRVLQLNHEFGVTAGYTISFRDLTLRTRAAIGLTAQKGLKQEQVNAIWQADGAEITLINEITHLKISTLPSCYRPRLTPRQQEVLEWVADGKSVQDIAQLMERTPATVEKHLRLAREAMNAETTAQAVLKASIQSQIFRFDRPS